MRRLVLQSPSCMDLRYVGRRQEYIKFNPVLASLETDQSSEYDATD